MARAVTNGGAAVAAGGARCRRTRGHSGCFIARGQGERVVPSPRRETPAPMRWYGSRTPADARGTGRARMARWLKGCGAGRVGASSRLGACAAWGRRGTSGRSGRGPEADMAGRSARARGSARVPLDVTFRLRLFRFTLVRLQLSQNFSTKVH
jgi:hypothetical protein